MSISAAEFEALQLQLIELKEAKYESQDREKKLLNEIKTLKEHTSSLENDLKKAEPSPSKTFSLSGVMSKSKDKKEIASLLSENEALQRNIELAAQEHKEQQEATMQNMKNMYAANKALEEEIGNFKKTVLEKDRKIEQQEGQLRKLQIQIIQYESSADIHKGHTENHAEESKENETGKGDKPSEESNGVENTSASSAGGKLEEDNNRLRENVKLLSTQLKALDEQLSTSETSYRSQLASLEQQITAFKEKIKQDEIATAHMEARLEEELSKTLKSKEELVTRLADVEEQSKREKSVSEEQSKRDKNLLEEQSKREKGIVDQIDEVRGQLDSMTAKFEATKLSRDEYTEQLKKVTAECESVSQTKTALEAKLRELETEARLLRKVRDEHTATLAELESSKNKIKNLEISIDRANSECAELAETKKELEQVRRELEAATTQAVSLQAEDALKVEAEQLKTENTKLEPLETEVDGLKLAHLQAVTAGQTFKEQYEEERSKLAEADSKVADAKAKLAEANGQVEALTAQVNKLTTEKEDLTTEYRVEERKNQRMIKELKSELQRERTSLSRSVSIEQLPVVPPSPIANTPRHSPPMSPVPLTPPAHAPRLTRQQSEALNSLPLLSASVGNMELSATTKEELLRRDLETSLTQFGKLAEDKWKLEEKTRFLEENLALVNEDLVRKTKVIQYYVGKTKQTVTNEHLAERDKARRQSGVRGALLRAGGNDQDLSLELLTKMEAVLEETVLKNIQLQTDLVTLGNETGVLQKEIRQLKEENKQLADESLQYKGQLMRIMSGPTA